MLAPVSVLAVWTANQASDTGRYVANMAPLIKDPAIQNALTGKLTHQTVTQIDVKRLTSHRVQPVRAEKPAPPGQMLCGTRPERSRERCLAGRSDSGWRAMIFGLWA